MSEVLEEAIQRLDQLKTAEAKVRLLAGLMLDEMEGCGISVLGYRASLEFFISTAFRQERAKLPLATE